MSDLNLTFAHTGETNRTYKFSEVNDEGVVLEIRDTVFVPIYIKKRFFHGKAPPKTLTIAVSFT